MALRIRDLDNLSQLDKLDLFETERNTDGKSYKVTGQTLTNFFIKANNAGYRGSYTKSMNDATIDDTGVWTYSGEPPSTSMASGGILEIFSPILPSDVTTQPYTLILRYTAGASVYVRTLTVTPGGSAPSGSSWGVLKNASGNLIFSGKTTESTVTFPTMDVGGVQISVFGSSTPMVTVTPTYSNSKVNVINLGNVTPSGFAVYRYSSSNVEVVTEEVTEVVEEGTTKTTTTTKKNIYGMWETEDVNFEYNWIATVDSPAGISE